MAYDVEIIDLDTANKLRSKYEDLSLFSAKVDINGICVQFFTSDREHIDMWEDNFYSSSDKVRSHAKMFSIVDIDVPMKLMYEPMTCSAFLFNFDYYGWIKSIALGITGNILEDSHDIFSIHGAAISIDGVGATLIAPSKTGKTTHSWGLLRLANSYLISDDWYFVSIAARQPIAYSSEKNCYIDSDIGDVWKEFEPLIKNVKFDNKGRGIANIRWVAGKDCMFQSSPIKYIFLMKRDKSDANIIRKITAEEGLEYLIVNDFCNPHQIVKSERKIRIRTEFFKKYLSDCEVYLVNTTGPPNDTQEKIREILNRCRI